MRRLIALLALLTALTACGAAPEQAEGPEDVPMTELAPAVSADSGALRDQAVFAQAAPEPLSYTVEMETLEDSTLSESGTELVRRSYQLPVMTVTAADGSLLTEADTLDEAAALEAAEAFNSQFTDWAAADGLDEMAAIAEEDRIFRTESGFPWNPPLPGADLLCLSDGTDGQRPGGVLHLYRRRPSQHGAAELEF